MSPRAIVGCMFVAVFAGLAVGVVAFGDYVIAECQRMSVHEAVLVWFGDGVALFWFMVYFVRHFIFGKAVNMQQGSSARMGRLWWIALVSITASMAVDLSYTLWLHDAERVAFAAAKHTEGTLKILRQTEIRTDLRFYQVSCSFIDQNQQPRSFKMTLRDPHEVDKLPIPVAQAIRGQKMAPQVAIAYQADRPGRSWLADLGWEHGHSMLEFSLCVLLFQVLFSLLFLTKMLQARRRTGALPWWYDLHPVLLVGIASMYFLLFGAIALLFDFPDFWV